MKMLLALMFLVLAASTATACERLSFRTERIVVQRQFVRAPIILRNQVLVQRQFVRQPLILRNEVRVRRTPLRSVGRAIFTRPLRSEAIIIQQNSCSAFMCR